VKDAEKRETKIIVGMVVSVKDAGLLEMRAIF